MLRIKLERLWTGLTLVLLFGVLLTLVGMIGVPPIPRTANLV